jgi:hypothetical protein
MAENQLRLWWKSCWSQEVRSAKATVAEHFSIARPEFTLVSVQLADVRESTFVFLVFFRRRLPTRPTPFVAYEYTKNSGKVSELPEAEGISYRPNAYK